MPVIPTPTSTPGTRLRALRHRRGHRLAHGTVLREHAGLDAQQVDLRLVAVGDDAALDVVGRTGDVGQARRGQPARARLRERDPGRTRAEQITHHDLERRAVGAERVRPERRAHVVDGRLQHAVRRVGVGGARVELEFDQAEGREDRGDDRRLARPPLRVQRLQDFFRVRLAASGDPHDSPVQPVGHRTFREAALHERVEHRAELARRSRQQEDDPGAVGHPLARRGAVHVVDAASRRR